MSRIPLFLFLVLLATGAEAAVEPADSPWTLQAWDAESGLPTNTITGLAQTADGFVWVTVQSHLQRFDGMRFVEFPVRQFGPDPKDPVQRVFAAKGGGMWFVMRSGRAFKAVGGDVRPLPAGLPSTDVRWIVESGDGALWVNYESGEIYRLAHGKVQAFDSSKGALPSSAHCFWEDRDGNLWVSRYGKITILRGDHFETVAQLRQRTRMCPAAAGGMWVASGNRLFRATASGAMHDHGVFLAIENDPEPSVMIEDRDGAVWIGTEHNGAFRYLDGHVEAIPTSHRDITTLLEDREGGMWVGTRGGGLNRITPRVVRLLDYKTESPYETIRSICQDTSGVVWATTQDFRLGQLTSHGWVTVSEQSDWPGGAATCVAAAADGSIWIGTKNGLLHHRQQGRYATLTAAEGLQARHVQALLSARNGDLWIGGRRPEGVQRLRNGKLHTFNVPASIRTLQGMTEDGTGDVWTGSSTGLLLRFHGDAVIDESERLATRTAAIHCLYHDGVNLWIGFASGLGRVKGDQFTKLTSAHGLHDSYISQIVPDGAGALWIGSDHGIFRIRQQDAIDVCEGRLSTVRSLHFGRGSGLPSLEAWFGETPNTLQSRDHRLWLPMRTALAVVDPGKYRAPERVPSALVEQVVVDNDRVALYGGALPSSEGADLARKAVALELDPRHLHLEFRFTGIYFTAPENIRFRYRLEGFDRDWIEAGEVRTATYSRLPAGRYRFQVVASTSERVGNNPIAEVAFVVTPFVWQTLWFRALALMGFSSLLVFVVRYVSFRKLRQRLRRLREKAALDEERARIARDIHDDVGNQLTEIMLLTGLAHRERAPERNYLQEISATAQRVIKSLDEIVWAINPRNDTLPHLVSFVGQFATGFLAAAGMTCVLDLPPHPEPYVLPADVRHNLFLAIKEALHNTVRHAHANEVHLSMSLVQRTLTVAITDDGSGFTPRPDDPLADGLRNMRQRMEAVGGSFTIESNIGVGTRVTLRHVFPETEIS